MPPMDRCPDAADTPQRMRDIPYLLTPDDASLSDSDGRSVWPVASPQVLKDMQDLTAMLGTVRLVPCATARSAPTEPQGSGAVAALEEDLAGAARLYAHLTGRRWIRVCGPKGLADAPGLQVLALRRDQLTPALLSALYRSDAQTPAPGLLIAARGSDLRRQILHRAMAALAPPRARPIATEAMLTLDFEALGHGASLILGNGADRDLKHAALAGNADLATVLTHSDGVDAYLDPGLTLCPMDNAALAGAERRPMCRITGQCFRHGMPIDTAVASGKLMSPSRLRMRILNWIVCSGLIPNAGVVDPHWGLVEDIITRAAIGAMTTTWSAATLSPVDLAPLRAALHMGEPIGRAVAQFNAAHGAGMQLAILGDPAVRAFEPGAAPDTAHPIYSAPRKADAPPPITTATKGGAALYLHAARPGCPEPLRPVLDRALSDFAAGRLAEARRGILDFVTRRGTQISHDWLSRSLGWQTAPAIDCPNCGASVLHRGYRLAGTQSGAQLRRFLAICPICGPISDAPGETGIRLSVSGLPGVVTLHGMPVHGDWAARLRIGCRRDGALYLRDWPDGPDGMPVRRLRLDGLDLPGPLQVSLILLEGAEISVATVPHTLDRVVASLPADLGLA